MFGSYSLHKEPIVCLDLTLFTKSLLCVWILLSSQRAYCVFGSYSLHKEPIVCLDLTLFTKSLLCVWILLSSQRAYCVHQSLPESSRNFTVLNRKQQGYQKSGSGENHYYVGYLGKTRISLPEYLISDHRHLMVSMY